MLESEVVSMLSPARRSRIGPMWVASTTGGVSNQTPVSLGSSPALGVLRESPSWLPNVFGTKRQNHSSTALKTGLRLVCSMRAKTYLYGYGKRPARTTKIHPTMVAGKTGQPSIRRRYRSASSSPAQYYLFTGKSSDGRCIRKSDSPSGVLHEGRKRDDRIARGLGARTLLPACSMRAASEPTESLGGSAPRFSFRRAP